MQRLKQFVQPERGRRTQDIVDRALQTVREHLGMDAAYLSEFIDDESMIFRALDAPGLAGIAEVGMSWPLNNAYCRLVASGELPELITDTREIELCQTIPVTDALPIRSHVSVPIYRNDGSIYGMFCCLGHEPQPGLNVRDLSVMRVFADLAGDQLRASLARRGEREALIARTREVLDAGDFSIKYQPIVCLATGQTTGFEALARFNGVPYRTPDKWFADADLVGLGAELELAAVRRALEIFHDLPDPFYVSINVGPAGLLSGGLCAALEGAPLDRVVVEVTEHKRLPEDDRLLTELASLRANGVKIAVDDAGAGYSGLQQIVRLSPDLLKLDMSLTRGIDSDPIRRSLAAALVHFGSEASCQIVAEGVEHSGERAVLFGLGVHRGQGWLFGRPMKRGEAVSHARSQSHAGGSAA